MEYSDCPHPPLDHPFWTRHWVGVPIAFTVKNLSLLVIIRNVFFWPVHVITSPYVPHYVAELTQYHVTLSLIKIPSSYSRQLLSTYLQSSVRKILQAIVKSFPLWKSWRGFLKYFLWGYICWCPRWVMWSSECGDPERVKCMKHHQPHPSSSSSSTHHAHSTPTTAHMWVQMSYIISCISHSSQRTIGWLPPQFSAA